GDVDGARVEVGGARVVDLVGARAGEVVVQRDDTGVGVLAQQPAYQAAADEAGAPRDQVEGCLGHAADDSSAADRPTLVRDRQAAATGAPASASGTLLRCDPSRYRTATVPPATSSSPAIAMNGIFCCCAVRIFFCIRSSDSSTSARMPCARSRETKSAR